MTTYLRLKNTICYCLTTGFYWPLV